MKELIVIIIPMNTTELKEYNRTHRGADKTRCFRLRIGMRAYATTDTAQLGEIVDKYRKDEGLL